VSISLVELAQGNHARLIIILADTYPRLTRTCERKTAPLIGQSLLSGVWLPNDRWCLVWAVTVKVTLVMD
jgi:hypothetical protein